MGGIELTPDIPDEPEGWPVPDKTPPEWAGAWGPRTWLNHRACAAGQASQGAEEYGLYSDVHVTNELRDDAIRPFALFNALMTNEASDMKLVLRAENHLGVGLRPVDWNERDDSTWVGMSLDEEYAALISLASGRRIRSGGITREFRIEPGEDPRGRPAWYVHRTLQVPRAADRHSLLPSARESLDIATTGELLALYGQADAATAIRLVRAARQYQLALWVCEEDAELAWLRLVGAVETIAQDEPLTKVDVVERLRTLWPALYEVLAEGGEQVLRRAAQLLAPQIKATQKFIDFLAKRLPPPPAARPQYDQVEWTPEALSDGLRVLYGHRSSALHGGKPWPGPLDRTLFMGEEVPAERPGAVAIGDSNWTVDDLPMSFHIFEYIVRSALQTWWREVATG